MLDFSNASFASFFAEEVGVNIELPQFSIEGESKGKRLRYFLRQASQAIALKTLLALWEYRTASKVLSDDEDLQRLEERLIAVSELEPHPRGYAFEEFLKELFDVYGMGGRASFRLAGEQVDGSFVHGNDTYLLEAKWTNLRVDAATLRSFNAKVEDKAA